ncbi:heat shock protein 30-like [Synchiropus picturatus]
MMTTRGLHSALRPFMDFYWPVCSLSPEVQVVLQRQHLLQRSLQHLICSHQDKIQKQPASAPVSAAVREDGGHYELTLDTTGFSPEDLSVRLQGRKLRVSGKTEKKQEEQEGWRWHSVQQFRQELELPEGVNPEDIICSLSPEGRLHIQAAKAPSVEEASRELSIQRSSQENQEESQASLPQHQPASKD